MGVCIFARKWVRRCVWLLVWGLLLWMDGVALGFWGWHGLALGGNGERKGRGWDGVPKWNGEWGWYRILKLIKTRSIAASSLVLVSLLSCVSCFAVLVGL